MLTTSIKFAQIASTVAHRIAELLYAPVLIVDGNGSVITSSNPNAMELPFLELKGEQTATRFLRIPLCYETETGEIIVNQPCHQEAISPRLAQALVELVTHQTKTRSRLPNQHELKNQLIHQLLHGRIDDESVVLSQAKRLSIDLTPPRAVILIDASDYVLKQGFSGLEAAEIDQQRRSHAIIGSIVSFFYLPNDTICADLGQGIIAVLKASDTKNLDPWVSRDEVSESPSSSWANLVVLRRAADALLNRLHRETGAVINIGIGRYHPGIHGLARSYEDAHVALSLGRRFQGNNRVHCLGEMGIAAFVGVADESTKIDLARYLLSPLDHEPDLLMTLDAFFAQNCCPSATAKQLSIHRNTLSYRLDKIASLTGLEARRFDDAVQMRLSLLLRSL